jgi:CPA2 family monovalent cation:H+ antiporter-2
VHLDPVLPGFVGLVFILLILALAASAIRQPVIFGYLLGGLLIGPSVLGLVDDVEMVERLGAVGVVLLLFFIGLEVSPRALAANWQVAVVGTVLQVALTTALVCGFGALLDWPLGVRLLLGFVVSLSSTAVVLKLLKDWGELDTRVGRDVLGILLIQDVIVIPMLIVLGLLTGKPLDARDVIQQLAGGIALVGVVVWVVRRPRFDPLPFIGMMKRDADLQVLMPLVVCFGFALFSASIHLSTALGAFVAGIVIRASRSTGPAEHSLGALRVLFVALFFASIGMLIDLGFIERHWWQVLALVAMVLVANTVLNGLLLRVLGRSWREGFYAGALLAQIGEFSFVLAAVGFQAGVITGDSYQTTVAVIAFGLLISPVWIKLVKFALDKAERLPTARQLRPAWAVTDRT